MGKLKVWPLILMIALIFLVAGCTDLEGEVSDGTLGNIVKSENGKNGTEEETEEADSKDQVSIDFSTRAAGLEFLKFNNRNVLGPFKDGMPYYSIAPDGETIAVWGWSDEHAIWVINAELDLINAVVVSGHNASSAHLTMDVAGWLDEKTIICATAGEHVEGKRSGQLGTGIYLAHWDGTKEELGWIDGETQLKQFYLTGDRQGVVLQLGTQVYRYDFATDELVQVKTGLPDYDGLFQMHSSPDGWMLAYVRYESDQQGIYLLDVKTGEEKPLAVNAKYNFQPIWSPDGEHIAFLASDRIDGGFDIIMGEAGPLPLANRVKVINVNGDHVTSLEMRDKVSKPGWSPSGEKIMFLTGVPDTSGFYFEPQIKWTGIGLWQMGESKAEELVALETEQHVELARFDSRSSEIFYREISNNGYKLWALDPKTGKTDVVVEASGWDGSTLFAQDKLYYLQNKGAGEEIFQTTVEGNKGEQITNTGGWKTNLSAANGKITFVRGENSAPYYYFLEIISVK